MKKLMLLVGFVALTAQAGDFTSELYGKLSKTPGNLFFSPASIEAALAMTAEGAAGNTKAQFDALLPPTSPVPDIGTNAVLENANAIWVDRPFPILECFRAAVTEKHKAQIYAADFSGQPDVERIKINDWVEQKTRDKIQDLLPAGSVNTMTRLLLVNAIYFKGDWLHAFDAKQTHEAPFSISSDKTIPVPMMQLSGKRFNYSENDFAQTLELPYEGQQVSMLLILPKRAGGLVHVEEGFASGNLAACTKEMQKREVNVFLPRFTIESTFASLKQTLAALGLMDAFHAQQADFSGISNQPLFISDVVHKAFVEVNEEGTEAAAATGIIMRTTSIGPPPVVFRADRPFLFVIRENASGKIIFMGRVVNPSE